MYTPVSSNASDQESRKKASGPSRGVSDSVRAQLALTAGAMASFEWDMRAEVVHCDAKLAEYFGLPPGKTAYGIADFFAQIHPDDVPDVDVAVNLAIDRGVDYHMEWRVVLPNGTHRWLEGRGRIVERDAQGQPIRMLGINWDITEQKELEVALTTMAMEMEHRVKNAFAMVSALIAMAGRRCETPNEMVQMLRGQIAALGSAHSLGVSSAGEPDGSLVSVADLISVLLNPWKSLKPTLLLDDTLRVDAQAAGSLSMMLYELTTNATKYGGLSADDAELTVSLRCGQQGEAILKWREAMPTRAPRLHPKSGVDGYGTILLAQAARALNAELRREFYPDGLQLTLVIPASSLKTIEGMEAKASA